MGGLGGEQRSKSLAKSANYLKNQVKLPALEELLQEERAGMASAGGTRRGGIGPATIRMHRFCKYA